MNDRLETLTNYPLVSLVRDDGHETPGVPWKGTHVDGRTGVVRGLPVSIVPNRSGRYVAWRLRTSDGRLLAHAGELDAERPGEPIKVHSGDRVILDSPTLTISITEPVETQGSDGQ